MIKRLTFLFMLFYAGTAMSQSLEQESNLKAVFIYNFTKYVEWDNLNGNEFVIGILGNSAIDKPLNDIAKLNLAKNKKIIIRHYYKPEDISYCHILFIPHNPNYSLQSILDRVGVGTLTVSEDPGYAKQGTAFNFIVDNDKIKFQANLKAIFQAGLKASAQLLKLAKIVD